MADEIDARVKALEDQVARLTELLESLSVKSVEGNLVLQLSEASDVSISVGNVGNNVSIENSGNLGDLSLSMAHVGNNVEINNGGEISDVSINTGAVGGSVVSSADAES